MGGQKAVGLHTQEHVSLKVLPSEHADMSIGHTQSQISVFRMRPFSVHVDSASKHVSS